MQNPPLKMVEITGGQHNTAQLHESEQDPALVALTAPQHRKPNTRRLGEHTTHYKLQIPMFEPNIIPSIEIGISTYGQQEGCV